MVLLEAQFKLIGTGANEEMLVVPHIGLRIGRGSDNDYILQANQISKRHLQFFWQNEMLFVEDLGSTNGTFVNERRLAEGTPYQINPGDVVRIGGVYFLLEMTYPAVADSEPAAIREEVSEDEIASRVLEELLRPEVVIRPTSTERESRTFSFPVAGDVEIGLPSPQEGSRWLKYLPAVFSEPDASGYQNNPSNFVGRFLLIFESIFDPIVWTVDGFDQFLSPEITPEDWLEWFASWFDIMLLPQLPMERKRAIVSELGLLSFRRGTRIGLERLLELSFEIKPEIVEYPELCHFVVRLPREAIEATGAKVEAIERLIASQKPAFTNFTLEVVDE